METIRSLGVDGIVKKFTSKKEIESRTAKSVAGLHISTIKMHLEIEEALESPGTGISDILREVVKEEARAEGMEPETADYRKFVGAKHTETMKFLKQALMNTILGNIEFSVVTKIARNKDLGVMNFLSQMTKYGPLGGEEAKKVMLQMDYSREDAEKVAQAYSFRKLFNPFWKLLSPNAAVIQVKNPDSYIPSNVYLPKVAAAKNYDELIGEHRDKINQILNTLIERHGVTGMRIVGPLMHFASETLSRATNDPLIKRSVAHECDKIAKRFTRDVSAPAASVGLHVQNNNTIESLQKQIEELKNTIRILSGQLAEMAALRQENAELKAQQADKPAKPSRVSKAAGRSSERPKKRLNKHPKDQGNREANFEATPGI